MFVLKLERGVGANKVSKRIESAQPFPLKAEALKALTDGKYTFAALFNKKDSKRNALCETYLRHYDEKLQRVVVDRKEVFQR